MHSKARGVGGHLNCVESTRFETLHKTPVLYFPINPASTIVLSTSISVTDYIMSSIYIYIKTA